MEGRRREQLWEGVKARATASRMSMTKSEEFERCAWYEELAEDGLEIEGLRACLPCAADEIFRRSDNRWSSKRTPVPQEQRFEALFDAARVLLNERIGDEDVVIPTLAFANGIDEGYVDLTDARRRLVEAHQAPELQEAETNRFVRSCPRFRPVSIVDGVVILE